jgi:hypothetical protein
MPRHCGPKLHVDTRTTACTRQAVASLRVCHIAVCLGVGLQPACRFGNISEISLQCLVHGCTATQGLRYGLSYEQLLTIRVSLTVSHGHQRSLARKWVLQMATGTLTVWRCSLMAICATLRTSEA